MASLISLGQIIDKTFAHYKKHFIELLSITAWIVVASVPAAVAQFLKPYITGTELSPLHLFTIILNDLGALLVAGVSIWALLSTIIAVSEEATSGTIEQKTIAKKAWKLFFSYVWVSILLALVVIAILTPPLLGFVFVLIDTLRGVSTVLSSLGSILMLIGSIVSLVLVIKYSIQYGFAPYSLALANERGVKALQHSAMLVSGRWWGTFFRFVLPKLLYSLCIMVLNIVLLATLSIILILILGDGNLYQAVGNATWFLISAAVTAFSLPLIAVTDYYIYDSLRSTRS